MPSWERRSLLLDLVMGYYSRTSEKHEILTRLGSLFHSHVHAVSRDVAFGLRDPREEVSQWLFETVGAVTRWPR